MMTSRSATACLAALLLAGPVADAIHAAMYGNALYPTPINSFLLVLGAVLGACSWIEHRAVCVERRRRELARRGITALEEWTEESHHTMD